MNTLLIESFLKYAAYKLRSYISLALPDPLRTGTYRLEIISAVLRGSGTIHSTKILTLNW